MKHKDGQLIYSLEAFKQKKTALWIKKSAPEVVAGILGIKKKKRKLLTQRTKKILIESALEAHNLDKSKTARQYYQEFVQRLREKFNEKEYLEKGIIEYD